MPYIIYIYVWFHPPQVVVPPPICYVAVGGGGSCVKIPCLYKCEQKRRYQSTQTPSFRHDSYVSFETFAVLQGIYSFDDDAMRTNARLLLFLHWPKIFGKGKNHIPWVSDSSWQRISCIQPLDFCPEGVLGRKKSLPKSIFDCNLKNHTKMNRKIIFQTQPVLVFGGTSPLNILFFDPEPEKKANQTLRVVSYWSTTIQCSIQRAGKILEFSGSLHSKGMNRLNWMTHEIHSLIPTQLSTSH